MKLLAELTPLEETSFEDKNDDRVISRIYVEYKDEKVVGGKSYPQVVILSVKSYVKLEKNKAYMCEIRVTNYEGRIYYRVLRAKELKL
jgi:hypothetical protein